MPCRLLSNNGLNILEPAEGSRTGVQSGRVVNLANWSEAGSSGLEPHEPNATDIVIMLGFRH